MAQTHPSGLGVVSVLIFISLVLAKDESNMNMLPSTMHIFSSGSRIICERLNKTTFDHRFQLLTCDVTTQAGLASECVVMTAPPRNVSINWLMATIYSASDIDPIDKVNHLLMLTNVNYCNRSKDVKRSLETNVLMQMTFMRALSHMDCPKLDGTIYLSKPGANVLELPIDECKTLIESWVEFHQNT